MNLFYAPLHQGIDSTINRVTDAKSDVVAIFNTNPDLVSILRFALERAGFIVVIGHVHDIRTGALDLPDFIVQHQPRVIIYDLVMPYDRNWAFLNHLRGSDLMMGRYFVLSAPNERAVREIVGPNEHVYEVVGDQDIDRIVLAVREAAKSRPTR
jgi:DNA-binding NarL/FixJ family response regulator